MPELAEVEIVRRNLERWWVRRAATAVEIPDPTALKSGTEAHLREALHTPLRAAERHGKSLLCVFDDHHLFVHFRMTGKIVPLDEPFHKSVRLAWKVTDEMWLGFKDQRRLGELHLIDHPEDLPFLVNLGPDALSVSGSDLRDRCSPGRSLKSALLDQSVVAGIGNIAVSELLWRARIAPDARCKDLDDDAWHRLVAEFVPYFQHVIDASMGDEVRFLGEGGHASGDDEIFEVYGHADTPCPRCDATIEVARVVGRSSYYCPACQSG